MRKLILLALGGMVWRYFNKQRPIGKAGRGHLPESPRTPIARNDEIAERAM